MVPVDTDAHFFGRVAASYTHEIKNVLATISEAGGLMEDILSLAPDKRSGFLDRLPRSLDVVQEQIERGQHLTRQFNAFAHAADQDPAQFALGETLEMMADLTQRLARRKKTTVEVQPDVQATLTVAPVAFLKLLFNGILWVVDRSGQQDNTIVLVAENLADSVVVSVRIQGEPGDGPQDSAAQDGLKDLARGLGGSFDWDDSQRTLHITAPKVPPSAP
jgi:signal transduction histidine kinase